ncbi:hsp70 family protein [Pseudomaricurvus alkylphenolicus]|uniref:Hsp70 family protein n=1 Tax=Pseudomaricurvus alkylphenolicus TaxID=1306991 RepID=UPI00141FC5EA|nr:Hsp70 family protein [Pseudomaricurvus alkylphenolicus]NIB40861.1 hsp70 family protein [Pseudomaricurvus alkylphenolicus]
MSQPKFHIGIDLGTTHTVVAYAAVAGGESQIFEIEQLVAAGEIGKRPYLPSFRYHPAAGELAETDVVLPWNQTLDDEIERVVIGEWARELGSKTDSRSVFSAKSWLSHNQVDRTAAILPWGAEADDVDKVSPLHASASYLFYLRCAWNHQHPEAPMELQDVVITIPASFDEMARSLTLEAAALAGVHRVKLLEEPQAACYDWYSLCQQQLSRQTLEQRQLMLIVDVGGGTTDLSLVQISTDASKPLPELKRIGVGDHLMLGGDNIDLAMAHIAEQQIAGNASKKLSTAQLAQLTQQTRIAKETLLNEPAPDTASVTVLGSGSRLIGGARSAALARDDIQQLALDGFLPLTDRHEQPDRQRSAIVELGLPYAAEPAISKHIAEFIHRHQTVCTEALGRSIDGDQLALPDVVLLNGGFFNSPILAQRCVELLNHWRQQQGQPAAELLVNHRPNDAVAFGAVAFGQAKRNRGLVIGGGSARSFFLEVPGKNQEKLAICVLPKGTDTEEAVPLSSRRFQLNLGQPVSFNLLASSGDLPYKAGELVSETDQSQLQLLPPVIAALEQRGNQQETLEVELQATLSEVGTLALECVNTRDSEQRWLLEFQIRKSGKPRTRLGALPERFDEALEKIETVYGQSDKEGNPKAIKTLRADLDRLLGPRDQWNSETLRALFDALLDSAKRRRRSAQHERNWLVLAGFTLRPGLGFPADEWRIEQIWPIIEAGLQYEDHQSWAAWWTFLRRIGGGFPGDVQEMIYDVFRHFLDPANLSKRQIMAELKDLSVEDMIRLAASLEHLPVATKVELGDWLLERLKQRGETLTSWWALGRVGSREPFYGHLENLVPLEVASRWLQAVLEQNWSKTPEAAQAAIMLARCTGDRGRDVDVKLRGEVAQRLKGIKVPELWVRMVTEVTELSDQESKVVLGDSLPSGLILME